MRILSWNINGIRTLPQYHPWYTLKTQEAILDEIDADIICFQEMKTTRSALDRPTAIPESYDSFFSFPITKGGYSGVATYTKSRNNVVPLKAEEGLSGILQPKPALSPDERISRNYPLAHEMELTPDELGNTPSDFVGLDSEGRALVLDFGLFVLINTYCPAESVEDRLSFKMNYILLLESRVRQLIKEGREVIVLGDINIASQPLDHGDGTLESTRKSFFDHPPRAWMKKWLEPHGPMIDAVRRFWPGREGMYTCWNLRTFARDSNYGSRVDHVLVTKGLLPWLKDGDIQPSIKGSDHCPIYIDLHDEIVDPVTGQKVTLKETMKMEERREPPRIAAKYWDEFSTKQTRLQSFFTKKQTNGSVAAAPGPTTDATTSGNKTLVAPLLSSLVEPSEAVSPSQAPTDDLPSLLPTSSSPSTVTSHRSQPTSTSASMTASTSNRSSPQTQPEPTRKKPALVAPPSPPPKKKRKTTGQAKLSSFFGKPNAPSSSVSRTSSITNPEILDLTMDAEELSSQPQSDDADYLFARTLQNEEEGRPSDSTEGKAAWANLFAPLPPPLCTVHGEPAKKLTVTKQGPNKGKTFFICSRPLGPGYDKGKSERLREEVDPRYKCNFFKWASEVKSASLRESASSSKEQSKSGNGK